MHVLVAIALKSLLIAGLTLGLLALLKRRSAAERSWVAHIGLLALVIMAFAPLVLPAWNVEAPALLGQAPSAEAAAENDVPAPAIAADTGRIQGGSGDGRPVTDDAQPRCGSDRGLRAPRRDPAVHHLPCARAADRACVPAPTSSSTATG